MKERFVNIGRAAVMLVFLSGFATPASADWLLTPYLGVTFGGNASFGDVGTFDDNFEKKVTYGVNATWMGAGIVGFEVDFGKAQNAYYELTRTVLPVMRRSAEAGSASATQWVDRFEALGERLAVRVGGETDDPESERGDRRIAGEGHIG